MENSYTFLFRKCHLLRNYLYGLIVVFCCCFTANAQTTVTLGSGTTQSTANTTEAGLGPVNQYYSYMHFQVVYTQAELLAAGAPAGGGYIKNFGWNVGTPPNNAIPGYTIKMANTTANSASPYVTTPSTTVYGSTNTTFTTGYSTMLSLTGYGFFWDGTSNLLVDICNSAIAPFTPPYGTVYTYGSTANSSNFYRSDTIPGCDTTSYSFTNNWKPQARFVFNPIAPATLDYLENFEGSGSGSNWVLDGTSTNKWWIGSPTSSGGWGSRGLYISNSVTGNNNNYSNGNTRVHAYRDIAIPAGVSYVSINYDWRARGNAADYFKVWLVPQSYTPAEGTAITATGGRILLNDNKFNNSEYPTFNTEINDNVNVSSFKGQNMRLVFEWINDNANPNSPTAAAIDNIQVLKGCSGTPSGGTASVSPNGGVPGATYTVSATGYTSGSGLTYQWQSNTNNAGWVNASSATTTYSNYSATAPSAGSVVWRLAVTCGAAPTTPAYSSSATYSVDKVVPSSGNNTYTMCSGTLYDSGGSTGNYPNNSDGYTVINPTTAGALVRITGGTINAEGGYDYLTIYDGVGTGGTVLWGGSRHGTGAACNNFTVPQITSLTGSLTVRFESDTFNNCSGFVLNMECFTPPTCTTPNAPANLNLAVTGTTINGSFTAPATAPSGYLIVRSTTATPPALPNPQNGTVYTTGATVGGYYIVRGSNAPSALTTFSDTGLALNTTYYYFVYSFNAGCSGAPYYNTSYITNSATILPTYCIASSNSGNYYIEQVKFLGTLNPDTNQTSGYTTGGYANYTANTNKAMQIPGEAINVYVSTKGPTGNIYSQMKAWVDWNNDGAFNDDNTERVYNSGVGISNETFGFLVPIATAPGNYRIRIRTSSTTNIAPCGNIFNGETEDYEIIVAADCTAKITAVTDGHRCGAGQVTVSASGTGSSYLWYTTANAGSPIPGETSATYSPTLSTTTTFYVTSYNGCETVYRTPVTAYIDPLPTITFTAEQPSICGEITSMQVSSSGDKETVTLLNEVFDENRGAFENSVEGNTNPNAYWINRTSTYIPGSPYTSLRPAVASGFFGNKFVMVNSDLNQGSTIINNLTMKNGVSTTNFSNLTLTFRLYAMFEGINANESLKVQVSQNGGAFQTVQTISTNQGIPNRFENITIPLNTYINTASLKIRFVFTAWAQTNQWAGDIVAIDDIKLFGEKPLSTSFSWTGSPGIIYNQDCVTPYNGTATTVCLKPSATMIETDAAWTVNATATLNNGCSASGSITIPNNTKTFQTTATGWEGGADWKPSGVPDATKCVIIKSPVSINSSTSNYQAFAKKVKIEAPGTLTVKSNATYASSLTVSEEFINNNTAENSVVLENNTSLKQLSGSTGINHGNITVHRNLDFTGARNEYNYLSTPVTFASGQSYKTIYPGVTSANYPSVLYYVESTRYFLQSSGANILGRSSAVKEAGTLSGITNNRAEFKGVPYVGDFTYPLAHSSTGLGFNLVGNPYPSNVDLQVLYSYNSSQIEPDFRFWDNKANDNGGQQHGAGYNGRAYARYNAVSNIGNEAGYYLNTSHPIIGSKKPNKILKVGQGMMVQALGSGKSLSWNNAPNVKTVENTGSVFFGKTSPDNRYWLTMKTPDNLVLTAAFTYLPELSNAFEKGDSKVTSGESDSFYSMTSDAEKVVINARSIFNTDDVVPLGTTHYAAGIYTISLGDHEGIFANGQNVYLKDKELNIVTNLSEGPYSFTSNSGQFTNRFEIVYLPQTTLDVTGFNKESVQIYRDGEDFVVKASTKNIKDVELYEMSGKLIFKKSAATREVRINAAQLANGIYMVRAFLDNGEVTTKKVRY